MAEILSHGSGHLSDLAQSVILRDSHQNRLIVAPGHHLHLAPRYQGGYPREEFRSVRQQPIAQRARIMEGDLDSGVTL